MLAVCLFVVCECLAFQFEDFVWGISEEQARGLLKQNRKKLTAAEAEGGIAYRDKLMGISCKIELLFTPESRVLYAVRATWDGVEAGPLARDFLSKRHHEPIQEEPGIDKYIWMDSGTEDIIALDYSAGKTDLWYSVGDEYEQGIRLEEGRQEQVDYF